ncbi:MAG: hypothetical protein ACKOSS_02425, partial [Planctomycetia bacterium]
MFVLRIRTAGGSQELRLAQPSTTLGSARGVDVRRTDAGWPALAGTLLVRGSRLVLRVPGPVGEVELVAGQVLHLGAAQLVCVPAPTPAPKPTSGSPPTPVAPARAAAAATATAAAVAGAPAAAPSRTAAPTSHATAPQAPATPAPTTEATPVSAAASAPARRAPGRKAAPVSARSALHGRSFDVEVYDQLRRMPWMVASVALHALVFLAFWIVAPLEDRDVQGGMGRVQSAMVTQEEHEQATPEPEPSPVPEEQAAPAEPTPLLEREPRVPTPESADAREIELGPMLVEEEAPTEMGTAPSMSAARQRTSPRPKVKVPTPAFSPEQQVDKGSSDAQRKQVADHLRERLGIGRGGAGQALAHLVADDVLVVQGEYDHHEHVLRDLQIPYRSVGYYEPRFASGEMLRRPRFVFWNCGNDPPQRVIDRVAGPLRSFVERGGFLFTSDWVVAHVLGRAFGEYVGTHGTAAGLPELVVDIRPGPGMATHPLLEGVFHEGVQGRWWLETKSVDCVVKKPDVVEVLIESPELKRTHKLSSAVAVTFPHGQGRVLHVVGHYDQEEGNVAGVVAVQRLALNFLLMSLRERPL